LDPGTKTNTKPNKILNKIIHREYIPSIKSIRDKLVSNQNTKTQEYINLIHSNQEQLHIKYKNDNRDECLTHLDVDKYKQLLDYNISKAQIISLKNDGDRNVSIITNKTTPNYTTIMNTLPTPINEQNVNNCNNFDNITTKSQIAKDIVNLKSIKNNVYVNNYKITNEVDNHNKNIYINLRINIKKKNYRRKQNYIYI